MGKNWSMINIYIQSWSSEDSNALEDLKCIHVIYGYKKYAR